MPGKSVRVRVDWDTDDEGDCGLPEVVGVPESVVEAEKKEEDDGTIADWLSDEYGFCVRGLSFIDNDALTVDFEHPGRTDRAPHV